MIVPVPFARLAIVAHPDGPVQKVIDVGRRNQRLFAKAFGRDFADFYLIVDTLFAYTASQEIIKLIYRVIQSLVRFFFNHNYVASSCGII